ncbi:site-specific tyrosine recombinase XerC [Planctomycetes bacterium Pan216]|uniref:Site-specific tyrosine recombinase XerC n=1 Tax=Kolteria novifilia TaxID=2527975 RepID=A0A518B216_9BACT|nr:site-specific tyrosine recombinase XerC [Planctomycetes bacterium Pan216]
MKQLDALMAVEHGLADRAILREQPAETVGLEDGRDAYLNYLVRPTSIGGVKPKTVKRYNSVLDKFLSFAKGRGVTTWNAVTESTVEAYIDWLDSHTDKYGYSTQCYEVRVIMQANRWLVKHDKLPKTSLLTIPMKKCVESTTYCYTSEEIVAIVDHCRQRPKLRWLGDVVVALVCTGMRISELANLRHADVDLDGNRILLVDESRHRRVGNKVARTTKTGRSRSFPIHRELRPILERLRSGEDGLVFHGPRGGCLKSDTVRNILVREVLTPLAERFPSPPDTSGFINGRLHSFRHAFCSQCANQGVPEPVVQQWLGHCSSEMVARYYHLHDQESQKHMQRVNFLLSR